MHRPGFRHQIAAAATHQIALFSLIRFKYSTLTHQIQALMVLWLELLAAISQVGVSNLAGRVHQE